MTEGESRDPRPGGRDSRPRQIPPSQGGCRLRSTLREHQEPAFSARRGSRRLVQDDSPDPADLTDGRAEAAHARPSCRRSPVSTREATGPGTQLQAWSWVILRRGGTVPIGERGSESPRRGRAAWSRVHVRCRAGGDDTLELSDQSDWSNSAAESRAEGPRKTQSPTFRRDWGRCDPAHDRKHVTRQAIGHSPRAIAPSPQLVGPKPNVPGPLSGLDEVP